MYFHFSLSFPSFLSLFPSQLLSLIVRSFWILFVSVSVSFVFRFKFLAFVTVFCSSILLAGSKEDCTEGIYPDSQQSVLEPLI